MATLGDMKSRIIAETNRDDLADDLAAALSRAITQAVEFYAPQRFWFNETSLSTACTPYSEYVSQPAGLRSIDRLSIQVGGNSYSLKARSFVAIDEMARSVASIGQPTDYAAFGYQVRLWCTPNIAYPLNFVGIVDLPALAADSDTNAWMDEAQDLIAARARKILFRDQFRDVAGAASAAEAEGEALARLMSETTRRLSTGRVRAHGC